MKQSVKHYAISKDRPLPATGRTYGKLIDLSEMEVGDSFTFSLTDQKRVETRVDTYGKTSGRSFVIAIQESISTCWRSA